MSWNYRVVHRAFPLPDGSLEHEYGVYEVYYDEQSRPNGCTENPVSVVGDTKEEVIEILMCIAVAYGEPTLEYDEFTAMEKRRIARTT